MAQPVFTMGDASQIVQLFYALIDLSAQHLRTHEQVEFLFALHEHDFRCVMGRMPTNMTLDIDIGLCNAYLNLVTPNECGEVQAIATADQHAYMLECRAYCHNAIGNRPAMIADRHAASLLRHPLRTQVKTFILQAGTHMAIAYLEARLATPDSNQRKLSS